MRSFLFAIASTAAIPGCLVGGADIPAAGDPSDDGAGGDPEQAAVAASVDKAALSTELGKLETLTITVTGKNGFSGGVAVAASVVDAAGAAVNGWTVTPTPASVDLTADGSAEIKLAVSIPSDAAVLSPKINVALRDAAGTGLAEVSAALTVAKQLTIDLAPTGTASPHLGWPPVGQSVTIRAGTKVVFRSTDAVAHVLHGSGGIQHQPAGQSLTAAASYTVTPTRNGSWWCHQHGEGSGAARTINVIP